MGVTRRVLNWYARLSPAHGKTLPPYKHVVQIGDPTLRKHSEPVAFDKIKTNDIQTVIEKLEHVINKYEALGMSAPQIGINMRIFAMQFTSKQISKLPKNIINARGLEVVPFTVSKYLNKHF